MDVSFLLLAGALLAQNDVLPPATLPYTPPAEIQSRPAPHATSGPSDAAGDRYGTAAAPAEVPNADRLVPVQPAGATSPRRLFLLHAALPPEAQLDGQPVPLTDVLSSQHAPAQHVAAAAAYWKLSGAVAHYCLCHEEIEQLERWAVAATPPAAEQALLEARLTAALAGMEQCRVDVLAAQHALVLAGGLAAAARLPLTSDAPHVGGYQTRIDALFSTGAIPQEMRFAADLLPPRSRAIELRAAAVAAAEEALEATQLQYTSGGAPLSTLLAAHDLWAAQNRALLEAIVQYNRAIASYALPLAPPGTASERLAAMLIRVPGAQQAAAVVQPAIAVGQPTRIVEPAALNVPSAMVKAASADPITATPDALTPSPDPLSTDPFQRPRQPLPPIQRPADLPPAGTPPIRGEPTLAPPLDSEPLTEDAAVRANDDGSGNQS